MFDASPRKQLQLFQGIPQGASEMKKFNKIANELLAYAANAAILVVTFAANSYSQATAPILPDNLVAGEGRSITVNISNGTRAALSVGTSNAFGVSTNLNAMKGTKASSKASLAPLTGGISTSLGASATEGAPPTVQADIQNVRTVGGGSTNFGTGAGTTGTMTSESDAQFAEGSTLLTGMSSAFEMDIDPSATSFSTSVENEEGGTGIDTVTVVSSAGSSANINSNMNVDISNTSFSSAFSQNF